MSTRTIIEINHDYLHRLDDPAVWREFVDALKSTSFVGELNQGRTPRLTDGIRALDQRHHSESITIKVE